MSKLMNTLHEVNNRRDFLKKSFAVALGAVVLGSIRAQAQTAAQLQTEIETNHGHGSIHLALACL